MALFENYEGRMPQLQPVLDKYGFASWEDLKAYNNSKGVEPNEAYAKNIGTYGRFKAEDGAVAWIDPRHQ